MFDDVTIGLLPNLKTQAYLKVLIQLSMNGAGTEVIFVISMKLQESHLNLLQLNMYY